MYKYLFIMLTISVCIGQDEWIYYNTSGLWTTDVYRTKPDNSESELFMESLTLLDISQDGSQILLEGNTGYGDVNLIYIKNFNAIDTLVIEGTIHWARLTQNENEIIYLKPFSGYLYNDQIYKYSFLDSSTTLIADSLYRWSNMREIVSPQRDKIAYFNRDGVGVAYGVHDYQLYVVDIHSGQTTFLTSIQADISIYYPPHSFWAIDDYIYLDIYNGTNNHLYKVHSSNTEIPITQLTDGDRSFGLLGSYSTDLDKLALLSYNDADSLSDLWIYELETNQLSYIDTIQGAWGLMQTWSNDNSKVAIGTAYLSANSGFSSFFPGSLTPIQIYDFVNDTITTLSDSYSLADEGGVVPLFWLGGQELDIRKNFDYIPTDYFLKQNYPNPFNPITTVRYELPEDSFVDVTVYDMLGNVVNNLVNTNQSSGHKSVQWNATNNQGEPVSAGVYLYKIQAGDFVDTKKMILLK